MRERDQPPRERSELTKRRSARTRESNSTLHMIDWMLRAEAPTMIAGLPSWWPFWSDALKDQVRRTVRVARELRVAEAAAHGHEATTI